MDKNQNNKGNQPTADLLKEKTNQDYNKQKPDPKDPLQNKNNQKDEENKEQIPLGKMNGKIDEPMSKERNREEEEDVEENDDSVKQVSFTNSDQKNRDHSAHSNHTEKK